MGGRPPLSVLQRLGYTGPKTIASFPPLILDTISTDLLLACDPEGGERSVGPLQFLGQPTGIRPRIWAPPGEGKKKTLLNCNIFVIVNV